MLYVESSSHLLLVSVCTCADGGSNCLYDNFSAEERGRLVECCSGCKYVYLPQSQGSLTLRQLMYHDCFKCMCRSCDGTSCAVHDIHKYTT